MAAEPGNRTIYFELFLAGRGLENSPAFQGWVGGGEKAKSRQGRKDDSAVPDGTG